MLAVEEVKAYRVEGLVKHPRGRFKFSRVVRAPRPEQAVEAVYCILGSKHRAKRSQIVVLTVSEEPLESQREGEEAGSSR